jgi:uracil-DNA glycosylase
MITIIMSKKVNIGTSWKTPLGDEFRKEYFARLSEFVRAEYMSHTIFPKPQNVFRAFEACPFNKVRVVILGQDPYHGTGQANGLSFAVPEEAPIPPSLQNIFKEIQSDLSIQPVRSGDLTRWANQGVLLLNATLTVRANSPGSHQKKGWEEFTDTVIKTISDAKEHVVFMLWGNYAKNKGARIDRSKHLVLESAHPSPFSANHGFFGNKHFSKTNQYLKELGLPEIDWK